MMHKDITLGLYDIFWDNLGASRRHLRLDLGPDPPASRHQGGADKHDNFSCLPDHLKKVRQEA